MISRSLVILLVVFVFIGKIFAQQPRDSKERYLPAKYRSVDMADASQKQIDTINSIAAELTSIRPDSTLLYSRLAYQLSKHISYSKGEALALLNISKAQYVKGSYDSSLVAATSAHAISVAIKFDQGTASSFNAIGLIYLAQNNFDQAIKEFSRALVLAKRIGDFRLQTKNNFNIGLCYNEKNQPEKAIPYLNETIALAKKYGDFRMNAMALNRMGETYYREGNYSKALEYYQQVVDYKLYQNNWENSFAHSGIAQSHLKLGNYPEAIESAHRGLEYAYLANAKWDIHRSLDILYQSYEANSDYKNAYLYFKKEKRYSDSLLNEAKETEINRLNLRQKQLENDRLHDQNADSLTRLKMSNRAVVIITVLAILLVFSKLLIYYFYRQKSKLNDSLLKKTADISAQNELILVQKQELEKINQTKDQLFAIIGHDLRSPFASILQAMQIMRDGDLSIAEMTLFLENFHEKVTVTALMLDNLVLWAESQRHGIKTVTKKIDIIEAVNQALIVFDFLIKEKNITLTHTHQNNLFIQADEDHTRLILHNLIGNAVKFTPQNGYIDVFYVEGEEYTTIHIKDSGVGIPEEKLKKIFNVVGKEISTYGTNKEVGIGIGLMLVREFADENQAKLNVQSEVGGGAKFSVGFLKSEG